MSKHSEWKQSGLDRRDFRNTKDAPETPRHRKKGGKGKVCKKNKGGPHEFTVRDDTNQFYTVDRCVHCGKHGRYYFTWR